MRWFRFVVPACTFLVVCAVWSEMAWGRAGGGQSFGGGGSGGGGGFGGGGGSGDGGLIYLIFWLIIHYPMIGIPVAVVLVGLMIYGGTEAKGASVNRTIRRGRVAQEEVARANALSAMRERDPLFDEQAFLDRAKSAFLRIQAAWSEHDLRPVRPFVSDGIDQRFTLQIQMQQEAGIRNVVEDVHVLQANLVSIHSGPQFDTLHVRFLASAVDFDVDLKSGRPRGGRGSSERFVEVWSFHRRPGTRSLSGPGAIEGNCPNCAAPLTMSDSAKCQACGSTVNSGEYDWVLAEITQESEWSVPQDLTDVSGAAELLARDPGFSIQHIEDRVSVMFWRLRAAEFFGDRGYAAPVIAEQAAESLFAGVHSGEREFWTNPAIGKVELYDVVHDEDDGVDRIRVVVRWSGIAMRGVPDGKQRQVRPQSIYSHVFKLERKSGVQSSAETTFSSAGCFQCGAPIAVSEDANCQYCGAVLTDGAREWVLTGVESYSSTLAFSGQEWLPKKTGGQIAPGGIELPLASLARVLWSDGYFDESEHAWIQKLGRQRGLTPEQIEAVIHTAEDREIPLPVPDDPREARTCLTQLVQAVMVDGTVSHAEKRMLTDYAKQLDLSVADIRLALKEERGRRYQAARQALKDRSAHSGA